LIYTALNIEEKDMIKLAVNLSMIFTEVPLIERFALARAQGFNHVEIQFPYELTIGQIQNQLSTHQLNLCLINVPAGDLMQGGHGLAGIPGQEIEFRHAVEQAIQYATALNVPRVNILAGKQPLDCDLLPCLNTLASNLKMACSMLLEHQIEPVFEMINGTDMPRFLIQNIAQAQEGARDLAAQMQNDGVGLVLNQFGNPDNVEAHYLTTGPEIWQQTGGKITHFVSSMGTTGTIMGVSKYLKEMNPDIQIVGLQPSDGSSIAGIRRWPEEYLPTIFDRSRVDRIIDIPQIEAEKTMRKLAQKEGISAGTSSGGAVWASIKLAEEHPDAVIVCIICDRGDRYLSTGLFSVQDPE
jgi:hydroxypyruvate isomerase